MSALTSDQNDSHISPVHADISRLNNKNDEKTNENVSSYTASTSMRDTGTQAKPTNRLTGKPNVTYLSLILGIPIQRIQKITRGTNAVVRIAVVTRTIMT